MKFKVSMWIAAGAICTMPLTVRADADRLKDAETVLTEMAGGGDQEIPTDLIKKAECIVIVPGVKKAAMGIGGQYGRGYMACRQSTGNWSAPGAVRVEGGSFGFQIGGSETDVVMIVMNEAGVDRLLSSKFTVGADAAVAAGPVGRQAAAQTDATMRAEMLAWSHSRGVFAGIALQGATLRDDTDENRWLYGKELTNREIVKGNMTAPPVARSFMEALDRY